MVDDLTDRQYIHGYPEESFTVVQPIYYSHPGLPPQTVQFRSSLNMIHRHRWMVSIIQCFMVWMVLTLTIIAIYVVDYTSSGPAEVENQFAQMNDWSDPLTFKYNKCDRDDYVFHQDDHDSAQTYVHCDLSQNSHSQHENTVVSELKSSMNQEGDPKIGAKDSSNRTSIKSIHEDTLELKRNSRDFMDASVNDVVDENGSFKDLTILETLKQKFELSKFARLLMRNSESKLRDRLDDVSNVNTVLVPSNDGLELFFQGKGKDYGDVEIAQFVAYHILPGHEYKMEKKHKNSLLSSGLVLDSLRHQAQKVRVFRGSQFDWIRDKIILCPQASSSIVNIDVPISDLNDLTTGDDGTKTRVKHGEGNLNFPGFGMNKRKKPKKYWFLNFCSKVTKSYQTRNGIIHELSYPILLPESTDSLIGTHMHEFSMAAQAFLLTETIKILAHYPGITLFLPTNEAFHKIPMKALHYLFSSAGRNFLTEIMRYHIVDTLIYSNQLVYGTDVVLDTFSFGKCLTLSLKKQKKKKKTFVSFDNRMENNTTENENGYVNVNVNVDGDAGENLRGNIDIEGNTEEAAHKKEKDIILINDSIRIVLADWVTKNGNVMLINELLVPPELDLYDPDFPHTILK